MKHQTREVMTPENPRWSKFIELLEGPEGCNFKKDKKRAYTWKCKGGTDKSYAIAILKEMGNIDIDASVEYFDEHGGHCDCEIVFNVNL